MADIFNLDQAWDTFFYYGKGDLDIESRMDLHQIIFQPKRSLYYNRRESAGVASYENNPNGLQLQVLMRFDIANAIAYRNSLVVDGTGGQKDRRLAVSQNFIGFESNGENLDVKILYFLFGNYNDVKIFDSPLKAI